MYILELLSILVIVLVFIILNNRYKKRLIAQLQTHLTYHQVERDNNELKNSMYYHYNRGVCEGLIIAIEIVEDKH